MADQCESAGDFNKLIQFCNVHGNGFRATVRRAVGADTQRVVSKEGALDGAPSLLGEG
jgi:hypothetical protein